MSNPRCPSEHLSSSLNLGVARIAWRVAGGAAGERAYLMIASLPSGRRLLLVAGRLLPLLDGGADIGRDLTPDELTGVTT